MKYWYHFPLAAHGCLIGVALLPVEILLHAVEALRGCRGAVLRCAAHACVAVRAEQPTQEMASVLGDGDRQGKPPKEFKKKKKQFDRLSESQES